MEAELTEPLRVADAALAVGPPLADEPQDRLAVGGAVAFGVGELEVAERARRLLDLTRLIF